MNKLEMAFLNTFCRFISDKEGTLLGFDIILLRIS